MGHPHGLESVSKHPTALLSEEISSAAEGQDIYVQSMYINSVSVDVMCKDGMDACITRRIF